MKVKLKIKTNQVLEDGQLQTIEAFYRGERVDKNGDIFVSFDEFDKVKISKTTIKISGDIVTIIKFGQVNTKIIFKEGFEQRTPYRTPYGVFDMRLYTYKLSKKIDDRQIKMGLDYKMEVTDLMKANNRIDISILTED